MPLIGGETPIICTGGEFIAPHLASERFVKTADNAGTVIDENPGKHLTIKYDNGLMDRVDTLPRYATTKRNSVIQISLNTLHKGDRFQKGQMLAWSNSFNGDALAIGKNISIAIMSYHGGKSLISSVYKISLIAGNFLELF
jgi:DNA-directed RNA polymerase beta subunit